MVIKGLQKTTLLDYPGKVSCIVFVGGCNFRCPFCHNSDLVLAPQKLPTIAEDDFFAFLKTRVGLLDGVVITGGEPTLYPDLSRFMKKVKGLGFLVKLDTNGSNPEMVRELIKDRLVDYIAMDLKGPLKKYQNYIGQSQNYGRKAEYIETTLKILTESGLEFELRTTVVPTLHTKEDLLKMARELQTIGFVTWYLQQFSPKKCLDPRFENIKPYPKSFFEDSLYEIKKYVQTTFLRGV